MIATEGNRYPHLFQFWREQGPGKTDRALAALFARLAHRAPLEIDDFDLAARQFIALIKADLQMGGLFGEAPGEAELEESAGKAVRTFLRAYGRPTGEQKKSELEAQH